VVQSLRIVMIDSIQYREDPLSRPLHSPTEARNRTVDSGLLTTPLGQGVAVAVEGRFVRERKRSPGIEVRMARLHPAGRRRNTRIRSVAPVRQYEGENGIVLWLWRGEPP
jgi:hypothetical protein